MLPGNTRKMDKTTVLEKVIGFLQKHNGNHYPLSVFLSLPAVSTRRLYQVGFHGDSDGKGSACVQEAGVQSLGWEDTMEKGMATHTGILAWRIPWIEEPGGLQSVGS